MQLGALCLWRVLSVSPELQAQSPVEFQPQVRWAGRCVAATVNPTNSDDALVASESGGLFQTWDAGDHWAHVGGLPMFRLTDVKFAPSSPPGQSIVLVSGWSDSHANDLGGIWRSIDGGFTWQRPQQPTNSCGSLRISTYGIGFEPDSGNAYVGTDCGLLVSRDWGASWSISYHQGAPGRTVSRVLAVAAQRGDIVDVWTDGGYQRSVDAGLTFGPLSPFEGGGAFHAIAASPLSTSVVFIATDVLSPGCQRMTTVFEGDYGPNGTLTWTQVNRGSCIGGLGRWPWVATNPSRDNNPAHFDIYFGDALTTWMQTVIAAPGSSPLVSSNAWIRVRATHPDQNGIAFRTANNCPQFLVSDGGVDIPVDIDDPLACGSRWRGGANGSNGFNALQLYEVAGQIRSGGADLYVGTQDNDLWCSTNSGLSWPFAAGGEGYGIQVLRYDQGSSDGLMTYLNPGTSWATQYITQSPLHFAAPTAWTNPPGVVANDASQPQSADYMPVVASPGVYIQFNAPYRGSHDNTLFVTTNSGVNWMAITNIHSILKGPPVVSRRGHAIVVYQPVTGHAFDFDTGDSIGLVRIEGLHRDGTLGSISVSDASGDLLAGTDIQSIGQYGMGEGSWRWSVPVFAVDPNDPSHLIAADALAQVMKFSTNGGAAWYRDQALTDLVVNRDSNTGQPEFAFHLDARQFGFGARISMRPPGVALQPHAVAFDPFRRNHILVGTEAAGIVRSTDGGQSWAAVPNSRAVTAITSFFFIENGYSDSADSVLISTYGRGLWKLRFPSNGWRPFRLEDSVASLWQSGWIRDRFTGDIISLEQFMNPDYCPICRYAVLASGHLTSIRTNSAGGIRSLTTDSEPLVPSSADGQPIQPAIDVALSKTEGPWDGCPACAGFINKGGEIRGLIYDESGVRAFIGGFGSLPGVTDVLAFALPERPIVPGPAVAPVPRAQIWVGSSEQPGKYIAYGVGFCAGSNCGPVTLSLGSEIVNSNLLVDSAGEFQVLLDVSLPRGVYQLNGSQSIPGGTNAALTWFNVGIFGPEEEPPLEIRIISIQRTAFGAVRLLVSAEAGETYTLERSKDLASWNQLQQITAAEDTFEFEDASATGLPGAFYRISAVP
jgi:photosystem II stability/assembly factor-like uncharacterized protein